MSILVRQALVILISMLAACTYGVIHDEITARLCLEYFTVAHPPLFRTHSTTLLALFWGVTATAGIGALLGFVLARVSQAGESAPWSFARLIRVLLLLLAAMAALASTAGCIGYWLSRLGYIVMPLRLASAIPTSHHERFMAVWFAHGASYVVGLFGAALVCSHVWKTRGRPRVVSVLPRTPAGRLRAIFLTIVLVWILWARLGAG